MALCAGLAKSKAATLRVMDCLISARRTEPDPRCPCQASRAMELVQCTILEGWRGPRNWLEWVNQSLTTNELADIRQSVARGAPYGQAAWMQRTAKRLGLESTLRPRGRPRKAPEDGKLGHSIQGQQSPRNLSCGKQIALDFLVSSIILCRAKSPGGKHGVA
jgi:hypothetical protein